MRDEFGVYNGAGQAKGRHMLTALESELQALIFAMQHSWCKGYKHSYLKEIVRGCEYPQQSFYQF